jgi:hypothetical protein
MSRFRVCARARARVCVCVCACVRVCVRVWERVTRDGAWIGEPIYWPLIHTTLKYKHLQSYRWSTHFTNHYTLSLLQPAVSPLVVAWQQFSTKQILQFLYLRRYPVVNTPQVIVNLIIMPSFLGIPYRTEIIAIAVLVITARHRPHRKHRSSIACAFLAQGTCLRSRCLETVAVYSPNLAVVA